MPLKVFTIPAHDDGGAAEAGNQFVASVRLVTLEKRFVEDGQLAGSRGLRSHELNRIRALVIEHRATFMEAWHAHFGS